VAENLHTDLAYSWRDFGKVKGKEDLKRGVIKYRGHHVTLGIRYDI
jgi:opacity protein-like surface antigen